MMKAISSGSMRSPSRTPSGSRAPALPQIDEKFPSDDPLRAASAVPALASIFEEVTTVDPLHAVWSQLGPPDRVRTGGLGAPLPRNGASNTLELLRGLGLAAAAGTKLSKSSSSSMVTAGHDAASIALGTIGAVGHGALVVNDTLSAFRVHQAVRGLARRREALVKAEAEARAGGLDSAAARYGRAVGIVDERIERLREARGEHLLDATVNAGVVSSSVLYSAGSAAAQIATPVALGALALNEARAARGSARESRAMRARGRALEAALASVVDPLEGLVASYNAKVRSAAPGEPWAAMPEVRAPREGIPALAQYVAKEKKRLDSRAQRLARKTGYEATTCLGATAAAIGYAIGEGFTATAGYVLMATGATAQGVDSLVRAVSKSRRHQRRGAVYAALEALFLSQDAGQLLAAATLELYTGRRIHAADFLDEPREALEFLRALEKSHFTPASPSIRDRNSAERSTASPPGSGARRRFVTRASAPVTGA